MYWKREGTWPVKFQEKQPAGSLIDTEGSEIVTMSSHFVFEKSPHNDKALSSLDLPQLGVDVRLTEISLHDIFLMGCDVANWISKMSGNGEVARLELPNGVDDYLR
jgi:hypothetical protein